MTKTKRALISMIVVTTVFCLSIIINIPLLFPLNQWDHINALDVVSRDTTTDTEEKQDSVIQSFSNTMVETEVFNVDEYLESKEAESRQTDSGSNQNASLTEAEASESTNSMAIDDDAAETNTNIASQADESVSSAKEAVEEKQPEALYANIGISVAKDYVNIRKEPTTDGEVLGKLYRNSAATILSTEGDWYYVESGSVTGYVKAEFIKTGISDDELVKNYSTLNILVAVDGLNVRKEESTESKKLTVIYKNEKYPVVEVDGDWILINIEDENMKGYIKKEFSELLVDFKDAVSKEEEQKILQVQAEERAKKETEVVYNNGVSYTLEDLKLLACLIHSEAGGQSYEGKLAVANVVLNRVKSSKYPDSIKSVIYQSGQFSVAASGSLDKQLNNYDNYNSSSQLMSIKAAKDALKGANNIGSRMYFHTYTAAAKKGYTNKSSSVKLGAHLFW